MSHIGSVTVALGEVAPVEIWNVALDMFSVPESSRCGKFP